MKITSMSQVPTTLGHKDRRYELDRLHGEDSAVYTWKGFQILVKFESVRRWRVICDTEDDTKEFKRGK